MIVFRHLFAFVTLPLLLLSVTLSYYRFIQEKDYLVGYDISCDPSTESCYVSCEDEACAEPEYYASAERYASVLDELCGEDITDCGAANTCTTEEISCSITYCDPDGEEECAGAESSEEAVEDPVEPTPSDSVLELPEDVPEMES